MADAAALEGMSIGVIGTGLIGTSVALAAAAARARMFVTDADPDRQRIAISMGAGSVLSEDQEPLDLVVVAVPPASVGHVASRMLVAHPQAVVTHVGSVQAQPLVDVETSGADSTRFVGGHPVAGREVSGPTAAASDLFVDRPWIICPGPRSSQESVERVRRLAQACGAVPMQMSAIEHDAVMARVSHLPQLVASALAASLQDLDAGAVAVAGTGLRDTTRLADSDPAMWGQIAAANAPALAAALRAVAEPLAELAERLDVASPQVVDELVRDLLHRGRAGRARLPGKHGRAPVALAVVECVVPDEPGALARLLGDIAGAEINVEDLRVEHAPGQAVGVAGLAVLPQDRERLLEMLVSRGWVAGSGPDEAL
jgi:prephenate dehydrogenase